jgi:hypothetical protein
METRQRKLPGFLCPRALILLLAHVDIAARIGQNIDATR